MKGREFYEFDGSCNCQLRVIDFGRVVLANGINRGPGERRYLLSAKVSGNCPPRPSGFLANNTTCMVFIKLVCDRFPEDFEVYHPFFASMTTTSECLLNDMTIVWGRNFAELVSWVAGISGLVKPSRGDFSDVDYKPLRNFRCSLCTGYR